MFVNDFNQLIQPDHVAVEVSHDDLKSLVATVISSATNVAPQDVIVFIIESSAYGQRLFSFDATTRVDEEAYERIKQFIEQEPDFSQWMLNAIFGEGSFIATKPNSLALASQDVFVYIPFKTYISKTFGL